MKFRGIWVDLGGWGGRSVSMGGLDVEVIF